jgi:hypothetical protein
MRRAMPPGNGRWPLLERVDRLARKLNPILVVVIIVLAILDVSCYTALQIGRLHPPRPVPPPPAASVTHLPRG